MPSKWGQFDSIFAPNSKIDIVRQRHEVTCDMSAKILDKLKIIYENELDCY